MFYSGCCKALTLVILNNNQVTIKHDLTVWSVRTEHEFVKNIIRGCYVRLPNIPFSLLGTKVETFLVEAIVNYQDH